MKTEDEARKCWCPYRGESEFGRSNAAGPGRLNCIASECMAWRWVDTGTSIEGSVKDHHWRPVGETDSGKRVCADNRGYCGLAGKT